MYILITRLNGPASEEERKPLLPFHYLLVIKARAIQTQLVSLLDYSDLLFSLSASKLPGSRLSGRSSTKLFLPRPYVGFFFIISWMLYTGCPETEAHSMGLHSQWNFESKSILMFFDPMISSRVICWQSLNQSGTFGSLASVGGAPHALLIGRHIKNYQLLREWSYQKTAKDFSTWNSVTNRRILIFFRNLETPCIY